MWPPALIPKQAKLGGDWSVIKRADGSRQAAYKGKPLYSFTGDKRIGDSAGDGKDGAWHVAKLPIPALPVGVSAVDVPDAIGVVLVDQRGRTLYTIADPAVVAKECPHDCPLRLPLEAPAVANSVGDFSPVARDDGVIQWAYKGMLLFSYAGDRDPLDVNGAENGWTPAYLYQHFMPADVRIANTTAQGKMLITLSGMTLYHRDTHWNDIGQGSRHVIHSPRGAPAIGRAIGTGTCNAACLISWHPLRPISDAQPSGYWDIATTADGTRQWVYKGYALYTYAGDKHPGDMNGEDVFDYLVDSPLNHDRTLTLTSALQQELKDSSNLLGPGGLDWSYMVP
jgi:predicted lipoprotein with Yx(FWY)xxD motif